MSDPPASDFFRSHLGTAEPLNERRHYRRRFVDLLLDVLLFASWRLRRIRAAGRRLPPVRVLVVGIEVPSRADDIHQTVGRLCQGSRHQVNVSIAPMQSQGKFANVDVAIARASQPLRSYDWLVIVDDDIALPPHALDDLIAIATKADLALAQPAHDLSSHITYRITQRRPGALARRTNFVEIGPLTLVRADLFTALVPFPSSRWCYGIDLVWSVAARQAMRRIGIIDGVPIRHLRPVAAAYDIDEARKEGQALIDAYHITDNRAELFALDERLLMV